MTREELLELVKLTSYERLPCLVGALAEAQAEAITRLVAPALEAMDIHEMVPLTEEWASARGLTFETAMQLADSGQLSGAELAADGDGKGRRRRWLVPDTLRRMF